jgi:small basic protein
VTVADKDVSVTYTKFSRIADGKIVENWYLSDSLGLAEQLGMKLVLGVRVIRTISHKQEKLVGF